MDMVEMDMVEMDMVDMHLAEQSWKPQAQVKRGPGISFSRRKHCKHIAAESCIELDQIHPVELIRAFQRNHDIKS